MIGDNGVGHVRPMLTPECGERGAGLPWVYETTDTLAVTGGVDTIKVGDGDNTILGGMGGDFITTDTRAVGGSTGSGTDTIIGDNGIVRMDVQGNKYASVATKSRASTGGSIVDLGGNDVIVVGIGEKRVLGGDGADSVTLGAGDHTVIGDNGVVTYVALSAGVAGGWGNAQKFETTDTIDVSVAVTGTGGADTITVTGNGNNTILGGMGGDTISLKTGSDTVLGDDGVVEMDAKGSTSRKVATKSQASTGGAIVSLGGDDTITALDGKKIVLGGDGADTIELGKNRRRRATTP